MANWKKFELSLKEVKEILHVDPGEEDGGWDETLSFRDDGIYLREVEGASMTLTSMETNALYGPNPKFRTPLLNFPCSLEDLERFIQRQGLYGTIDPFALAESLVAQLDGPARSIQSRRETAIIDELESMGLTPTELPASYEQGERGPKAGVWQRLEHNPLFRTPSGASRRAFERVWERMRKNGQLMDGK